MTAPTIILGEADILKVRAILESAQRPETRIGGMVSADRLPPSGPVRPGSGIVFP